MKFHDKGRLKSVKAYFLLERCGGCAVAGKAHIAKWILGNPSFKPQQILLNSLPSQLKYSDLWHWWTSNAGIQKLKCSVTWQKQHSLSLLFYSWVRIWKFWEIYYMWNPSVVCHNSYFSNVENVFLEKAHSRVSSTRASSSLVPLLLLNLHIVICAYYAFGLLHLFVVICTSYTFPLLHLFYRTWVLYARAVNDGQSRTVHNVQFG